MSWRILWEDLAQLPLMTRLGAAMRQASDKGSDTLGRLVREQAQRIPEQILLRFETENVSYSRFNARTNAFADVFKTADGVTGPMKRYLTLLPKHADRLELLPHAAADTDHPTRVAGAKQAVDQIIEAISERRAVNLKGKLPLGYTDAGGKTVPGVGAVSRRSLAQAAASETVHSARRTAEKLAAIWGALDAATDPARREQLVARYGADLVKASNVYRTLMEQTGIEGRFA